MPPQVGKNYHLEVCPELSLVSPFPAYYVNVKDVLRPQV